MHLRRRTTVVFLDQLLEVFDSELLFWSAFAVFLAVFGIGALFFAPLEGMFCGASLAVFMHMFVSDWNDGAERRRYRRPRSVFIDVNEVRLYSLQAASFSPPKGGSK